MVLGSCDRGWVSNLRNCPWDRAFMRRDKWPAKYPIRRDQPGLSPHRIGSAPFPLSRVHKPVAVSEAVVMSREGDRHPANDPHQACHIQRGRLALSIYSQTRGKQEPLVMSRARAVHPLIPRFAWKRLLQSVKHVTLCDMLKDSPDKLCPKDSMSRHYLRQIWIAKTRKCTQRLWRLKGR